MDHMSNTSTSHRNGPPPAEHSYQNETPRCCSSGLQSHVPASYDREPNGVSRSDSRRTDDYELHQDGCLDRHGDCHGGNDMEIDFDEHPNYRHVPSNERPPPTRPNDRHGHESGTKGILYNRDYVNNPKDGLVKMNSQRDQGLYPSEVSCCHLSQ